MKKQFVIRLSLALVSLMGCENKSPLEKITPLFERVKNETVFNLIEVKQKKISGLNILDFSIEFDDETKQSVYAKANVTSNKSQTVSFGSSSNIPFAIFVNGEIQFNQPTTRDFHFSEIAYDMFAFQDTFQLHFTNGENEIIVKAISNQKSKIFFKEEVKPDEEAKVEFSDWIFSRAELNKKTKSIKVLSCENHEWQKQKIVMQHSNEKPKVRVYPRESHDEWTYSNGATMLGLMNVYNYTNDEKIFNYVKKFCDYTIANYEILRNDYYNRNSLRSGNYRMFRKIMLDDSGAPTLPLILTYSKTKDEKYLPIINEMTEYVSHGQVRLNDGTLCRPEPVEVTIWADDMFMSATLLVRAYKLNGDTALLDDAVKQIENIHKYLWDENAQLHKHAWFDNEKKQSEIFWSRANGWIIWTITDALKFIPKESKSYNSVMKIYKKTINGLIKYQTKNGLWNQVLDNTESFQETSGSAMYTLAIAAGVNNGWLPRSYSKYAIKGWDGVASKISDDGIAIDICRGTGVGYDEEFYLKRKRFPNDPRGLGAIFTCAVEVEKLMENN